MVYVFHIKFHPSVERDIASAFDLPEAGDPRFNAEPSAVRNLAESIKVAHWQRSWADQAHVTLENV